MHVCLQMLTQTPGDYGVFILQTLAALGVMALGAWLLVRFWGHRFRATKGSQRLKVIERLVLEPRRSVYLIEVDGTTLLIGTAEGGVRLLKPLSGPTPSDDDEVAP